MKIFFACILAAVLYGIAHDMITAHLCVEYFSVFHPPVFNTVSPTLLALGWGVIATWWAGGIIGAPLALVSRSGSHPKLTLSDLMRPIAILMSVMAACAVVAGVTGYLWGPVPDDVAAVLPVAKYRNFVADLWAHSVSYLIGFIGGIVLCVVAYRMRLQRRGTVQNVAEKI
ncbi:MAG: hypothetical protein ABSC48_07485 [Terracidiphilus sp.]|jgi:hypothetical protein